MSAAPAGAGLAVVVNANAKRGGRRVAAQLRRALPGATIKLTRSLAELEDFLAALPTPRALFAAGGDGTAVSLLNALARVHPDPATRLPPLGALPLGTGNAWARSLGAPSLDACVRALARAQGPLPTRAYRVFECDGLLTYFAGCGWDAQVLDDYRAQVEASPSSRLAKSVWGYLSAMALRTVPKTLAHGRPHVLVENLADEVHTITADRKLLTLSGLGRGAVLYEGMASVAGCATCPEYGYGFRAFPHAERLLGSMSVRIYDRAALAAVADIPLLWRGAHPLRGMHDWFSTHVRMTFSRPMPLQVAGEAVGIRQSVEFAMSPRALDAVDWRAFD